MNIALERDVDANASHVAQRQTIVDRLDAEDRGDLSAPLEKCGWMNLFRCKCCGSGEMIPHRCKKRYCPVCAPIIAARLTDRYRSTLKNMKWPLFSSWTTFHTKLFPCPGFQELFAAHKQIRRQLWFSNKVRGGIVAGELTADGPNGWHVHLHSMIDCRWLSVTINEPAFNCSKRHFQKRAQQSRAEITRQWEMAIGRPADVWSQRANGEKAVQEILKYSVKGSDLCNAADEIAPIVDMMKRCRLVRSWGTMYGHLRDAEEDEPPRACGHCGMQEGIMPADVYEALARKGVCA